MSFVETIAHTTVALEDALRAAAVNSSFNASRALSKWLKRGVSLYTDGFERVPLSEVSGAAGEIDAPVVAVHMTLEGTIQGDVLLALPEPVSLKLIDLLIDAPPGTTKSLGEFELSAVQETGNIVATSFANNLAQWLNQKVIPASPVCIHDLACAVIQPLLCAEAAHSDAAWMTKTVFELDSQRLDWCMLLLLSGESLERIRNACQVDKTRENALHAVVVNAAFSASRAISKWIKRGVRLSADTFRKVGLAQAAKSVSSAEKIVALHMELTHQLHGHLILALDLPAARDLVERLMPGIETSEEELGEMSRSCLQETANILATAFANSVAKWLELETEPSSPELCIDMPEAAFESVLGAQALVSDDVLMSKAVFHVEGSRFECGLYFVPAPSSYRIIEAFFS